MVQGYKGLGEYTRSAMSDALSRAASVNEQRTHSACRSLSYHYTVCVLGFEGKYRVMENGVDFPRGRADKNDADELRAAYGIDKDMPLFISVFAFKAQTTEIFTCSVAYHPDFVAGSDVGHDEFGGLLCHKLIGQSGVYLNIKFCVVKLNICLMNDSFPPLVDGVANTVVNYADVISTQLFYYSIIWLVIQEIFHTNSVNVRENQPKTYAVY